MSITNILIHVADVANSVDFYHRHLGAEVVTADRVHATLGFVTATIELRALARGVPSRWSEDDAVRGFRHIGFKVSDLDAVVAGLDADGVRFRSRPQSLEHEGIRIAFFFDPDGTVLELVEGHLRYHRVRNADGAAAERRLPPPPRPRFDHIGHSVDDQAAAVARYAAAGFRHVGAILWPNLHLEFLHSGGTVLELFRVPDRTEPADLGTDSLGFVGIELDRPVSGLEPIGQLPDGRLLASDPDGLGVVLPIGVRSP